MGESRIKNDNWTSTISEAPGLCIIRNKNQRTIYTVGQGIKLPKTSAIIPSGDRPPRVVRFPCATQSNTDLYWASIETDGKINLYKGGNVASETSYMIFNASYCVE